eukprot:1149713-Pelagomonas_calceolata.AAC.3
MDLAGAVAMFQPPCAATQGLTPQRCPPRPGCRFGAAVEWQWQRLYRSTGVGSLRQCPPVRGHCLAGVCHGGGGGGAAAGAAALVSAKQPAQGTAQLAACAALCIRRTGPASLLIAAAAAGAAAAVTAAVLIAAAAAAAAGAPAGVSSRWVACVLLRTTQCHAHGCQPPHTTPVRSVDDRQARCSCNAAGLGSHASTSAAAAVAAAGLACLGQETQARRPLEPQTPMVAAAGVGPAAGVGVASAAGA